MTATKRALLACACLLAAVGLLVLICDLFQMASSNPGLTDIAGVVDGSVVEWPTGERPVWALVPAYAYGLAFLVMACAVLYVHRRIGTPYSSRARGGAE
ncbi:MAG: hypothetical protein WCQ21_06535 [Verrucomicrobiota bacterium]